MRRTPDSAALTLAAVLIWGCAGADNPMALADLDPVAEFEITASEVETMREVELTARVREGGALMHLQNAQIEVQPPTGPARLVSLAGDEDGYSAHLRFYEPGEHHIHLLGQPERHYLMREMGEHEIDVEPQHQIHDDHRFELSVSQAPIAVGIPTTITLYGWEIELDGTLGHEAEGLQLHAALHLPSGTEAPITLTEVEHGQYSVEIALPFAGSYELAVEIEEEEASHSLVGADPDEDHDDGHGSGMSFEIYVPSATDGVGDPPAGEGDDHGHGH